MSGDESADRLVDGLVDVHAHYLSDAYVEAAVAAGHHSPDGMPAWPAWSVQAHLELMQHCGIARSMLSISSPGVHFGDDAAARRLAREMNDVGADIARQRSDRFGLFAVLPLPDIEGSLAEIEYALDDLQADGVAVESNARGRYLGDPGFEPVLAELDRRSAVVFVHPTSPPNWAQVALGRPRPMLEFLFDTTRTVSDLIFSGALERYQNLRLVIPHGGATLPLLGERIELFRSVFATGADRSETGASTRDLLRRLWYDTAGTPFPVQIPTLSSVVSTERIVYGSDYCFTPAAGVDAQVRSLDDAAPPAPGDTWRALTTRNAGVLLNAGRPESET